MNGPVADLLELARTGRAMRDAQRAFFRDRRPDQLRIARDWERRFDERCRTVLAAYDPQDRLEFSE
jgi:hypothetical protein